MLARLSCPQKRNLLQRWAAWAHAGQRPDPDGDWRVWMILAGRGYGKTRAGAEWVTDMALAHPGCRIALVGATMDDVRQVMVEGESGLIAVARDGARPHWSPSLGELRYPNGSIAFCYSAEAHARLRGPAHHFAWCDELAKWKADEEAYSNLVLGLRLGPRPRMMVTTTPRPNPLLRTLMTEGGVVVRQGATRDNPHLPPRFVAQVEALYGGRAIGRRELDGEMIDEIEGALWSRALIEQLRVAPAAAHATRMQRIIIGVDPPAGSGSTSSGGRPGRGGEHRATGDACGIVAVGLGADGLAYVLADHSIHAASPEAWAAAVARAAAHWGADRVVAEANQGGAMVESVLRAADVRLPVRRVHASRGKSARAEPVLALYEAGRVRHAGAFAALEDEMCALTLGGGYVRPLWRGGSSAASETGSRRGATDRAGQSPDRADALVWALTELMLGGGRGGGAPLPGSRALPRIRWV